MCFSLKSRLSYPLRIPSSVCCGFLYRVLLIRFFSNSQPLDCRSLRSTMEKDPILLSVGKVGFMCGENRGGHGKFANCHKSKDASGIPAASDSSAQ